MNSEIERITEIIRARSTPTRQAYLKKMRLYDPSKPNRSRLMDINLSQCFSIASARDKKLLTADASPLIGIVGAISDVSSEHALFPEYVQVIKKEANRSDAVAVYAGGVTTMSPFVSMGMPAMDLTLLNRDVITTSTVMALSSQMYDGVAFLAASDRSVSGMLMGALSFGYLPYVFIPSGPRSGQSGAKVSEIVNKMLLNESRHSRGEAYQNADAVFNTPGSHTLYNGTNTCQMLMEIMGLHLPGMSFVAPQTPLREVMTQEAIRILVRNTELQGTQKPLAKVIDERTIVNAIVGLVSTGGTTDFSMDLIAIARAAGIIINWDDIDAIAKQVPLLARIYPNGDSHLNDFCLAGGTAFLIRELCQAGLLHDDVETIFGTGLSDYCSEPYLQGAKLNWRPGSTESFITETLRPVNDPFFDGGGLRLMQGNLGRGLLKTYDLDEKHSSITAPAKVYVSLSAVEDDFKNDKLNQDCVIVLIHQGMQARGMPEQHLIFPVLSELNKRGHKVALISDGRQSYSIPNVPMVAQMTPESCLGGVLAKVKNGDQIKIDCLEGMCELLVSDKELSRRQPLIHEEDIAHDMIARDLLKNLRWLSVSPEEGASSLFSRENTPDHKFRVIN